MKLNQDILNRSHYWLSQHPERRAEQAQAAFAARLADIRSTLEGWNADCGGEFDRIASILCSAWNDYYSRLGRCASTFITGGSNFNHRRNEKANRSADTQHDRCLELQEKLLKRAKRRLAPHLSPIMSGDADAIERLETKLKSLKEFQELMKAANKVCRSTRLDTDSKKAQLNLMGIDDTYRLLNPTYSYERVGFQPWKISNNNANIKRIEGRLAQLRRAKAAPVQTAEREGLRIEDCPADNRLRLFFDGKPSEAIRSTLKSNGFRWTPSLGCWQAYRNDKAFNAVKGL
jgi:hypothetical protein